MRPRLNRPTLTLAAAVAVTVAALVASLFGVLPAFVDEPGGRARQTLPGPSVAVPQDAISSGFGEGRWTQAEASVDAPLSQLFAAAGAEAGDRVRVVAVSEADGALVLDRSGFGTLAQAREAAAAYQDDPDTLAVSIDTQVVALDDPGQTQQWAHRRLATSRVWTRASGAGAVVAIVDTGIDAAHEDLAGALVPGADFVGDSYSSEQGRVDPQGHGTHVAGIVAARAGNGRGGAGIAPQARVMPLRVLDADGAGWNSDIAEAIIYATDHGADVINLSLGGPTRDEATKTAVEYAVARGVVVVAAAGNNRLKGNAPTFPAAYDAVIGVGSITRTDTASEFSNTGAYVDVVAPGSDIYSTAPRALEPAGYRLMSGTSMATPHVAALAALARDASDRKLDPTMFYRALMETADDLGTPGRDDTFGHGLIDPYDALCLLLACNGTGPGDDGPDTDPTPTPDPQPETPSPDPVLSQPRIAFTSTGGTVFEGTRQGVEFTVTDRATGKPLAGVLVKVTTTKASGKGRTFKVLTDSSGRGEITVTIWETLTVSAAVKPSEANTSAVASSIQWKAVPVIAISYSSSEATTTFKRPKGHRATYQVLRGRTWRTWATVTPDRKGRATATQLPAGTWRVVVPATDRSAELISNPWTT